MQKLETLVNAKRGLIDQCLKILEVEGAVVKEDGGWDRTPNRWDADRERMEAVTEVRREELREMQSYASTGGCLMRFLTANLDDPGDENCERWANCTTPFLPTAPDPRLITEATLFLKRGYRPIEPRKAWPAHLGEPRGRIHPDLQLAEGRALALYGDAGWGTLVKEGKVNGAGFADELVAATAVMVESDLRPNPAPAWVACVPSRRTGELVPNFAQRLADRLGLPFRRALEKTEENPPQKTMENSVQQARNAIGAFAANPEEIMEGPVLLVDDMVDSRWSVTVCGIALREAGSGPVYPIALGETTPGGGL